jgi:hypothetical protein
MMLDRRVVMVAWMAVLALSLVVSIGLPATFALLSELIWWR